MKFTKGKVAVVVIAVIVVVALFSLEKIGGSEDGEFRFASAKPLVKENKVFLKVGFEGSELFLGPPEIHLYGPDGSELYDGKVREGQSYKLIPITSENQTPASGEYRVELVSEKLLMEERYFEFDGSDLKVRNLSVESSRSGAHNYILEGVEVSVKNKGDLPAFVRPRIELGNATQYTSTSSFIGTGKSKTFHFEVSKSVDPGDYEINIFLEVNGEVFEDSESVSIR